MLLFSLPDGIAWLNQLILFYGGEKFGIHSGSKVVLTPWKFSLVLGLKSLGGPVQERRDLCSLILLLFDNTEKIKLFIYTKKHFTSIIRIQKMQPDMYCFITNENNR